MTRKMKYYLAAKFSRREEMEVLSEQLRALGHEPTCRWVYGGEEGLSDADIAELDLEDVSRADTVILFTHERSTPQPGGGRFVEFGYGMALGLWPVVIGPRENVFINHPDVTRFDTWDEFIGLIT